MNLAENLSEYKRKLLPKIAQREKLAVSYVDPKSVKYLSDADREMLSAIDIRSFPWMSESPINGVCVWNDDASVRKRVKAIRGVFARNSLRTREVDLWEVFRTDYGTKTAAIKVSDYDVLVIRDALGYEDKLSALDALEYLLRESVGGPLVFLICPHDSKWLQENRPDIIPVLGDYDLWSLT